MRVGRSEVSVSYASSCDSTGPCRALLETYIHRDVVVGEPGDGKAKGIVPERRDAVDLSAVGSVALAPLEDVLVALGGGDKGLHLGLDTFENAKGWVP